MSEVRQFAALFFIQFLVVLKKESQRENIWNFFQTSHWIIEHTMIEYPDCLFPGF